MHVGSHVALIALHAGVETHVYRDPGDLGPAERWCTGETVPLALDAYRSVTVYHRRTMRVGWCDHACLDCAGCTQYVHPLRYMRH